MSYKIIYEPVATKEYKEAISWYAERSEKAADNFIKEFKEKQSAIRNNPFRYRNTYKIFRETSLNRFPFSIVYFVSEDNKTIIISSVYHHRRNHHKKYRK